MCLIEDKIVPQEDGFYISETTKLANSNAVCAREEESSLPLNNFNLLDKE